MKFWLAIFAALLSFPLSVSQAMAFPQEDMGQLAEQMAAKMQSPGVKRSGDVEENQGTAKGDDIFFNFQDQQWKVVIPWFAEKAGLSLQHIERFPAGTFNIKDNDVYSPLEALDQLNRSLAGLKEPFTLIRNRNMLLLKPLNEAIRDELIQSVKPSELDQRGAFELMSVIFDLGELDGRQISADLKSQVSPQNQKYFNVFEASNQLQVRETGARLRNIRDIIEMAKKKLADSKPSFKTYELKFQDAETFTAIVGAQLGIPAGKTTNKDETITINSVPLSNQLYVSGTKKMLEQFDLIASMVDFDPDTQEENTVFEKPYLTTYPITIDPELAFDLLGTMLEGRDALMQQDKVNGAITVRGRKADHELVVESLASVANAKTKNFSIIQLEKIAVTEVLSAVSYTHLTLPTIYSV